MNTNEDEEEDEEDQAFDFFDGRDEYDGEEPDSELSSAIAFGSTLAEVSGPRHPGCSSFKATCKTLLGKACILQGSMLEVMVKSHKNYTRHS